MSNRLTVILRLVLCLLCLACTSAAAIGLERSLAQLEHTSWTSRNGAPGEINALAQDSDGWLWLGTSQGLYRFDGLRFEKVTPSAPQRFPDTDVYALHADADGGIWIGWRLGGISHYRNGVARNWAAKDGVTPGSIWGFAADASGTWAAGIEGLNRFDGRRWQRVGAEQGFTARKASAVFVDADGAVTALSEQGLFVKRPGAARFARMAGKLDARQPLAQRRGPAARGAPVYILEQGGIRIIDSLERYEHQGRPWIYRQKGEVTGSMLVDRAGALWYDVEGAIHRSVAPERAAAPAGAEHAPDTQSFTVAQGLSGSLVAAFLEDSDGNVWVATDRGLDRFRQTNVVRLGEPLRASTSLAPADGEGMIGATEERNWRLHGDGAAAELPGPPAVHALASPDGVLLVQRSTLSLRSLDGRRTLRQVPLPRDLGPVGRIHTATVEADGTIWIAIIGGGVQRYSDGKWERPAALPKAGHKTPMSLLADARGRMWFGYIDNEVAMLERGRVSTFGAAQGLGAGKVATLVDYGGTIFAGGSDGVSRLAGARFTPVVVRPASAATGIAGGAGSAEGLWLHGAAGIVLLDAKALASGGGVDARVFDDGDGLRGRSSILDTGGLQRARDGRIWASTGQGAFWIDPAAVRPEAVPQRASVTRVEADGKAYDASGPLRLPPAPQRLMLRYASPALSIPDRIAYRYRLEGYDRDWQQAGPSIEAVYTGLPPGDYRFVVRAVNGAGVPGPASVALPLHVAPTLVQTTWFRIACAVLLLAGLWALHRQRLRIHDRRQRALAHTRSEERNRIARELHDTLLQSVQGLILRFDAVTLQLPAGDPLRLSLDAALARAGTVVAEARDRVQDLRAPERKMLDLAPLLAGEVAAVRKECNGECTFEVLGERRPLPADGADACCRIVTEAVRNACRHAQAAHVKVLLAYAPGSVRITVSDDGKGIDEDILRQGRVGHWGIAGMRERARGAGGVLDIVSAPGQGTTLTLDMPG